MKEPLSAIAERFMRGVYAGDTSVVEDLASDDIVISYPIFEELFGAPAIRGRDSAREFAIRFSSRWAESQLIIHEKIWQGDRVVLVWEFSARRVGAIAPDQLPTNERRSWGGITLFEFDGRGRVLAEIGEESTPGPMDRTKPASAT